jgi:inosine-uridine nucleoside N-ribohydrolase
MIATHAYYAWDPLAAVATTDETVLRTRPQVIEVVRTGDERGRTVVRDGEANTLVG